MEKFFLEEFLHEEDRCDYKVVDVADDTVVFEGRLEDVPRDLFGCELVGCMFRLGDDGGSTFVARIVREG